MFSIDNKWATILSDFCLDISKAYFIAAFVSPAINIVSSAQIFFVLIRGIINVIIFLWFSRYLLQIKK
ncbi:hypothetical protein CO165_04515 [Candidatus Roizmanbacteria bacterium CG_4_9_14_3_um_filter_33_18]|uniref:Uncharacterized protein n=2 Tax=Candidatus Roizmaniibacteriota TaxID=1752723 RepID=A0A2M7XWZ3_9BACT|nr:MAG: hypothetical protein COW97_02740 [Candidatus Roizmanbacteria bacterium CG22_combo_CG10-13_8_21_14_all_34_12]PJA55253.1 MAG: hypothetical protein CO165_04515 [Candidatus Roizmanbacteria bacterium CG_4_9_14_3_um_filter_33_18]